MYDKDCQGGVIQLPRDRMDVEKMLALKSKPTLTLMADKKRSVDALVYIINQQSVSTQVRHKPAQSSGRIGEFRKVVECMERGQGVKGEYDDDDSGSYDSGVPSSPEYMDGNMDDNADVVPIYIRSDPHNPTPDVDAALIRTDMGAEMACKSVRMAGCGAGNVAGDTEGNNGALEMYPAQEKMEGGWKFVKEHLKSAPLHVNLALSEIVEFYLDYCSEKDLEPVTTSVLVRIIKAVHRDARKIRLGPRNSQKIHYCCVQWVGKGAKVPTDKHSQPHSPRVPKKKAFTTQGRMLGQGEVNGKKRDCIGEDLDDDESERKQPQDVKESEQGEGRDRKQIEQEERENGKQNQQEEGWDRKQADQEEGSKSRGKRGQGDEKECKEERLDKNEGEGRGEEVYTADRPNREDDGGDDDGDDVNQRECDDAAGKLAQFVITQHGQNKLPDLLRCFAHSASCPRQTCSPVCLMFRRVRRHLIGKQHPCGVLQVYTAILRAHVAWCTSPNCDLPACPVLRATHAQKRAREEQQSTNKRARSLPAPNASPAPPAGPPTLTDVQLILMSVVQHRGA